MQSWKCFSSFALALSFNSAYAAEPNVVPETEPVAHGELFCDGTQVISGIECLDEHLASGSICLRGDSFVIKEKMRSGTWQFAALTDTAIIYDTLYAMKPNEKFPTYALRFVYVNWALREIKTLTVKDCSVEPVISTVPVTP